MTSTGDGQDLPTAAEIRAAIERRKQDKATGELMLNVAAEEEEKHRKELFLARKLTPDFIAWSWRASALRLSAVRWRS